jgi:hypothetical protein
MTSIDEAIKKSEDFYKKFRKAYKTIPPFYRGLGKEAALAYFRRVLSKRSTAHWHLDYNGVRYWFWRIWEDEGGSKFDSKTHVAALLPWWQKRGIARYNLWFYSFNKPKEATK